MNAAARRRPLRRRRLAALALIALSYTSYRTLWGTPFTVGMLADRQQLIALLHDPEALTELGLIDGSVLDWHPDRLSPISLAHQSRPSVSTSATPTPGDDSPKSLGSE